MEKLDQLEVISGRRHVGIMYAEPVVNYGIRLRGRVVTCKEKRELPNNSDFHSNQSNGVVVLNRHSSFCKSGLCSRQRPLVRRENNCRGARATDGGDNTCDYGLIWVKKMRRRKSSFEEGMNREKVCMTLLTSSATLTLDSYHGSKLMPSLTSLIFG
ncbi:uncharacterized protein LOC130983277 isoform X3 [Arachis stenosperma]|uniref:uncharacterized protein LOC130983277 isoform X3 n=1 Tax=Arachis stenosperma TaxID=217475 RepID=UPI0025AD394C|nr:uncharacterized protein LOC130983277 isoform X3 [Arachis stenosperma]XP_057763477.1 uncharacterized protein LOC130983277 isoform X3 [Arachis stenosperma]